MLSDDPILARLNALSVRREHGTSTVSVLAGPLGLGVRAWLDWTRIAGRRVARTSDAVGNALARSWVAEVVASADPTAAAITWLASATGEPAAVSSHRLGRMTLFDFDRQ